MPTTVESYIRRSTKWPKEMAALRPILLDCGLDEAIKWGKPCFSADGPFIAIMQEMNAFLALMFFKGALLDDPDGLLREQGPNSRSARRLEFTSVDDITALDPAVRQFITQAIAVERAGLTVGPAPEPTLVPELTQRIRSDTAFREAFEGLTPGRRREYNIYFAGAKQSATRTIRIDRMAARILSGKGMRDR